MNLIFKNDECRKEFEADEQNAEIVNDYYDELTGFDCVENSIGGFDCDDCGGLLVAHYERYLFEVY